MKLLGVGTAVPGTTISQDDAAALACKLCCETPEQVTWLPLMYSQTGIEQRHLVYDPQVVRDVLEGTTRSGSIFVPSLAPGKAGPTTAQRMAVYQQEAGPLVVRAAQQAVLASGVRPSDFTHLITVSCTGFHAPGVDIALIRNLELRATIERTQIGFMGCHGALNGLRVARAFCQANRTARVLLCAVELCSLHYHYGWDPGKMVANALFADGAAAVVGVPDASPGGDDWHVATTGSCVLPHAESAMTWLIGEHGFEMTLSKQVPHLIGEHLRPWMQSWLKQSDLELSDIASWAVHPGGPRILTAVEAGLELDSQALADSRAVLASHGNMSSPTILFILDRLRQRQASRPCVALGFGPGLVAEAVLFR